MLRPTSEFGSTFMTEKPKGPVPDSDLNDTSSVLKLLATRRSALAKDMIEPGPTAEQVDEMIALATRVPDHGKLAPWRFLVFEGEGRAHAGDILADRWRALYPDHGEATLAQQRETLLRAPVVIGVVSSPTMDHPKVPVFEQELSAGAVCQNLLMAATAMGFGCQWITGWYAFDDQIAKAFGLSGDERFAGFIYLGTAGAALSDRPRPDSAALVQRYAG